MSDESTTNPTASADSGDGSIFGPMHLTRAMIGVVAVVFAFVFKYAADWLHWPRELGFGGSLAQPPVSLGAFVAVLVLLVLCTALGTVVLGRRWFLAGLMAATAGLATWSVRGGPMIHVLFNADNNGTHGKVFLPMLGELIVLFGVIGGLWTVIWNSAGGSTPGAVPMPKSAPDSHAAKRKRKILVILFGFYGHFWAIQSERAAMTPRQEEGRSTGAGLLVQAVLMAVLLMILAVTPMKKQVLTSVFVAGLVATAVAEYFFADRTTARWYWVAPLIVGAAGYLLAYFNPVGIETGDLQGTFAPLARVLPLDYASLGCAGVLFGYWWMEPDVEQDETEGNSTDSESPTSNAA